MVDGRGSSNSSCRTACMGAGTRPVGVRDCHPPRPGRLRARSSDRTPTMRLTRDRLQGSVMVALAQVVVMTLPGGLPTPDPVSDSNSPVVRQCAFDYCPPGIPGPVTDWPWSAHTHFLRLAGTKVELANLEGSIVWTVPMN